MLPVTHRLHVSLLTCARLLMVIATSEMKVIPLLRFMSLAVGGYEGIWKKLKPLKRARMVYCREGK